MKYDKIIKRQSFVILLSIAVFLLLIIGFSYALFVQLNSSKNNQILVAGDLSVEFEDNSGIITTDMVPLSDTEALTKEDNIYDFTIINNGTLNASYSVTLRNNLEVVENNNNLLAHQYIRISFDGGTPFTLAAATIMEGTDSTGQENDYVYLISSGLKINASASQEHSVRVWIDENAPLDIIGKNISLKIGINAQTGAPWDDVCQEDSQTLNCQILSQNGGKNAIIDKGTPSYELAATTDEGIYMTGDNFGRSYYYRGAVTNNYVFFDDYLWRIIRINGDGSIRLIYAGTLADETPYISSSAYNISTDNCHIGYVCNETASTIKTVIDDWYTAMSAAPMVITSTFINDTKIAAVNENLTTYAPQTRLINYQPSLLNTVPNDIAYGGNYRINIGLITMDEVMLAGGNETPNQQYYLASGGNFWTMSPDSDLVSGGSHVRKVMMVNSSGQIVASNITTAAQIRPVIAIPNDTLYSCATPGNTCGTKVNPYLININ